MLALMATSAAFAVQDPVLPPLQLTYGVSRGGTELGDATLTLTPHGRPGCYRYLSQTEPIGIVRLFVGSPSELSEFCVVAGEVVPQRFEYRDPKGRDDGFVLEFDHKKDVVRDQKGRVRPLPDNAQDRLGLHQAVRLWLLDEANRKKREFAEFTVVEDDRMRRYRFGVIARQELETKAGRFDALVVERLDDPSKITRFWIAPSLDYMPVRVERIRDGKLQFSMTLKPSP